MRMPGESLAQVRVYQWFKNNRDIWIGSKSLSKELGIPESSVRWALRHLVARGVLTQAAVGTGYLYNLSEHPVPEEVLKLERASEAFN